MLNENIKSTPSEKLGKILQNARLKSNLSIEELSEKTKITRSYIVSLENSDYDNFSKLLYTKGFLKILAKELSLDIEILNEKLFEELGLEGKKAQAIDYEEYFIDEHVDSKYHVPSILKNKITLIILIVVIIYVCIVIAKVFIGGINMGNSQHVSVFNAPANQIASGSDSSSGSGTSTTAVLAVKTLHSVNKMAVSGSSISGASDDSGKPSKTVALPDNVTTIDLTSGELQQKMVKIQKQQASQAAQDSGASID
ncbi:MAG: helix-turn-helix transcriptional regulator [Fusobacteria bacterium]|nr:helix-turn-helix transcriptional regulator [Fusobacteriota bacterium]